MSYTSTKVLGLKQFCLSTQTEQTETTECCEKIEMLSEFLLSAKIIKTFYDLHAFSGPEKAVEVNHDSVNNINEDLTQPRIF